MGLGKNYLAIQHQCIHVIDLARNIVLQQVEGLPVTKRVQTLPELFRRIDPGNANGGGFRARFEHPGRRDARQVLAKLIVVQDVNEIGHRYFVLLSLDTHRQLVSKVADTAIAHAGHTEMFTQSCGSPDVIVVQGNDDINQT